MKYYSEKLDTMFDTPKALRAAEAAAAKESPESPAAENAETAATPQAPTKKQLAADVAAAEDVLKKAYTEYDLAKKKATERYEAYLREVAAILDPAKKAVKDAEQAKYDAINRFNKAFGPYQVVYTGSRAADEFLRALDDLRTTRTFFNSWF